MLLAYPGHAEVRGKGITQADHQCSNDYFCKPCKQWVNFQEHKCFLRAASVKSTPSHGGKYLFVDLETMQDSSDGKHEVNLVCTEEQDGTRWPEFTDLSAWLQYLLDNDKYKGSTLIAHNGQGFDFVFIMSAMINCGTRLTIRPIMNGSRFSTSPPQHRIVMARTLGIAL